jgi:hypothetical protein
LPSIGISISFCPLAAFRGFLADFAGFAGWATPTLWRSASEARPRRDRRLCGFNAPFDWWFVNYHFHRLGVGNPFGFTALGIKSWLGNSVALLAAPSQLLMEPRRTNSAHLHRPWRASKNY